MDDDAPLSALAKAPKTSSKFDDDTPLVALAAPAAAKPKVGAKVAASSTTKGLPRTSSATSLPRTSSATKVSASKDKTPKPKKTASGSSSSSSSSYSSSSGSDSQGKVARKRKRVTKAKAKVLKRKDSQANADGDGDEEAQPPLKKKDRTPKEQIVAELLCRWWYALPEWPPVDKEYYDAELKKRSLRRVTIEEWEWVPDDDGNGFRKCYELSQFRGVFRNSNGDMVDVRPQETCPCLNQFMKKDTTVLLDLLVKAYENQLKELQEVGNEPKLENELRAQLTRAREKAYQASQVGGLKKSRTF